MNNTLAQILRFTGLILLQIFVLNNIHLFGFLTPSIYLIALFLLPLEIPQSAQFLIAFVTGIIIDFFSMTWGIHASACMTIMFIRPYIVKLLNGRRTSEGIEKPIPGVKDFKWLLMYTLILVFTHHFFTTLLETFSFKRFGFTLLTIVLNTVFTSFLILCTEYIFIPIKKK